MLKWLDEICDEQDLDMLDLQACSGLSIDKIGRILSRRWTPSPEQRKVLSNIVGVDVDDIIWGHENLVNGDIKQS